MNFLRLFFCFLNYIKVATCRKLLKPLDNCSMLKMISDYGYSSFWMINKWRKIGESFCLSFFFCIFVRKIFIFYWKNIYKLLTKHSDGDILIMCLIWEYQDKKSFLPTLVPPSECRGCKKIICSYFSPTHEKPSDLRKHFTSYNSHQNSGGISFCLKK